jgi:AAA family ATP:ADP antiporter
MEAVLQTRGLLSLPTNPKNRVLLQPNSLKHRFLSLKPKTLIGSSLNSNGFSKINSFSSKVNGFGQNGKNLFICKAEAAAASSDGQPVFGEIEVEKKPKILGIEIDTMKKILPLGLMFFCILFNYTILRDTKDVLVVTAKGSSAEIIPFLKTWVNLPMAIGFMLLYTKLSNVLSKQALFYTVILPFIAFFGAFGFVLYPLSNYIHPEAFADKLLNVLGPRFLGPLAIIRIWSFCLFYVMAELWGSVVVSVLFWGFANQVYFLFHYFTFCLLLFV